MHRFLEELSRPTVESARQSDAMMGTQTEITSIAARVRVTYEENGRAWEEDLFLDGQVSQMFSQNINLGNMVQSMWWFADATGARAPAGTLDKARALLEPIRASIRRTQKYAALIFELNMQLVRGEAEALNRAAQIWIQNQNRILNDHGSRVASNQDGTDKAHRDFLNYINDVEDYKTTDGSTVSLPAYYDRVLTNSRGDYLLTNDHFFNNADWTEINRAC